MAWIKVITGEIASVYTESEDSLIVMVCKECIKSVDLFLSKVEDMIYNGNEIKQVNQNPQNGTFIKNSHQDHNTQLLILLTNLRNEIEKLPSHVLRIALETSTGEFESTFSSHSTNVLKSQTDNDDNSNKHFGIKLFLGKFSKFLCNKVGIYHHISIYILFLPYAISYPIFRLII